MHVQRLTRKISKQSLEQTETAAHRFAGRMDVGSQKQWLVHDRLLLVVDHQESISPVRAHRELRKATTLCGQEQKAWRSADGTTPMIPTGASNPQAKQAPSRGSPVLPGLHDLQ